MKAGTWINQITERDMKQTEDKLSLNERCVSFLMKSVIRIYKEDLDPSAQRHESQVKAELAWDV